MILMRTSLKYAAHTRMRRVPELFETHRDTQMFQTNTQRGVSLRAQVSRRCCCCCCCQPLVCFLSCCGHDGIHSFQSLFFFFFFFFFFYIPFYLTTLWQTRPGDRENKREKEERKKKKIYIYIYNKKKKKKVVGKVNKEGEERERKKENGG